MFLNLSAKKKNSFLKRSKKKKIIVCFTCNCFEYVNACLILDSERISWQYNTNIVVCDYNSNSFKKKKIFKIIETNIHQRSSG